MDTFALSKRSQYRLVCVLDPAAGKPHNSISLLWTEPLWVVNLIYSLPQLQMSLPSATDHYRCPLYIIKPQNPIFNTPS